jgi:hypothetical protein
MEPSARGVFRDTRPDHQRPRCLLPLLYERSMQPNEEPGDDARRMSCERSAPWGASSTTGPLRLDVTSSVTGLLKPQHKFLDFA